MAATPPGGNSSPPGTPGNTNDPDTGKAPRVSNPQAPPFTQTMPQMSDQFAGGGPIKMTGGPQNMNTAGQSFQNPSNLTNVTPFDQSPGIQVAQQHGYDPGQTYSGQAVTGDRIQSDPFVGAALKNFNLNVAPGIQNQMNSAGLGRSSAAADAMAKAQASLMPSLYQQSAGLEQQQIQNQIQGGQFSAGLGQQDLTRLQGATESELGRRQASDQAAQAGQQQLFSNMMQLSGAQNQQQMSGAQNLFNMGTQAQQTGQQVNSNAYQDMLRSMGLSEEAINPFGGISGLLGTVTSGK